jgi:hypothetical protein
MASTTNLGIEKLNSSDYVSVDPINNAFDKLDALGADYVIESGTSDDWWYRKWKSGRAECGVDIKNFGTVSYKTAWGSLYRSDSSYSFGAYPFAFAAAPYVNIQFLASSSPKQASFAVVQSSSDTATSPKFFFVDPYSESADNVRFGIHVSGRWK